METQAVTLSTKSLTARRNRAQSRDALEVSYGDHRCQRCGTKRSDEPTITGAVKFMGETGRRLHICRRCVNTMHDVAYMDEREG